MILEQDERRSAPRFGVELAAAIVDADGGELDIKVIDISNGGAALLAPVPLGRGKSFTIKLPVHTELGEMVLTIMAFVRHSIAGSTWEDGTKQVVHVIGVEFEFESLEDLALHETFVSALKNGSEMPLLAKPE